MFDFNRFQSNAVSAVAAFLLATVSVGAAVGPAQAGSASPQLAAAASVNADV